MLQRRETFLQYPFLHYGTEGSRQDEKLDNVFDRDRIFADCSFCADGKFHGIYHLRTDPGADRGH